MGADPVINPYQPQDLNPYSYGMNSPLWLPDPSGMCFLGCFWNQSWFRPVLSIAVAAVGVYFMPAFLASEFPGTFAAATAGSAAAATAPNAAALVATGAITGGASGAISTGSLKGALIGAFEGAAFAEIGGLHLNLTNPAELLESAGLHGLVGGLASAAGGGNFGSGFLAAGFSGLAGRVELDQGLVGGTVISSVVGGVSSVLGGGKFANGAETGAFGYLFNDALDKLREANLRHQDAVDQEVKDLRAQGYNVEGQNVLARIPGMPNRYYDVVATDPSGQRIGIEVKTTIGDIFRINNQQMTFDVEALRGSAVTAAGPIAGVSYVGVSFGGSTAAYFSRLDLAIQAREKGVLFYGRQQ